MSSVIDIDHTLNYVETSLVIWSGAIFIIIIKC